ncbi:lysyl oxidase family protein [Actinoplanes sp. NPDC051633]|uniref:lysyl oxidase family protein n=1 Tax=Actinoplanes sp. NPDC051633 TaxID=3155670 RepID=UPI0034468E95
MKRMLSAFLIPALVLTGAAPAAAEEPPTLAFRAASHDVVVNRYVDPFGVYLEFDLGVSLIAGRDAVEIRAKRRTYADPITAQQILISPDGQRHVTDLPAGFVSSFDGFSDFTSITIRDTAGAVLRDYTTPWCPNSYNSVRTRPDAPATTPYPQDCGWLGNPFYIGSVWGVQAGWNAPIGTEPPWAGEPFDLQPGDYRINVRLNDKYREWLDVSEEDATVELNVRVVNREWGTPARAPQANKRATGHAAQHAAQHAAEGDAQHQVAAFDPEFRPPAKVPATLPAVPAGPKPDLRSLPAWAIVLDPQPDGRTYVAFSATVWNGGTSKVQVDGFRRTGEDLMDAYQYFYDAAGNEVGSMKVGTMEWDAREGHLHWHFTDFAQYNLLTADKQLAVRSSKEAFCLANTDPVDYTLPNAKWRPTNTDLTSSCGGNSAVAVREVMDIGNGDTYMQYLPGQSFDITDVPNGTYWIEVLANPDRKLAETRTGNNSALRKIIVGGTPGGERTLRVPALHGLDPGPIGPPSAQTVRR